MIEILATRIALIFAAASCTYLAVVVIQTFQAPESQNSFPIILNFATAIFFGLFALALKWKEPSPGLAHPLLFVAGCVFLFNVCVRVYYTPGAGIMMFLIIGIAAGAFMCSVRWITAFASLILTATVYLQFWIGTDNIPFSFIPSAIGGALIGLLVCRLRIRFAHEEIRIAKLFKATTMDLRASLAYVEEARRKYHELLSNINVGVAVWDKNGRILFGNKRLEEYLNVNLDETRGKTAHEIGIEAFTIENTPIPYKDRPAHKVLQSRQPIFNQLLRLPQQDGTKLLWSMVSAFPSLALDGQVDEVVETYVDVTHQKLAQDQLRISEQRQRTVFDLSPDAYFILTIDGVFLDGNRLSEKLAGIPKEMMYGNNILTSGLLSKSESDQLGKIFKSIEPSKATDSVFLGTYDFTVHRPDGSTVPVEIGSYLTMLNGDSVIFASARDISSRIEAEDRSRKNEAVLHETEQIALVGGWELDIESGELWWTDGMYDIHGIPIGETQSTADYIHHYDEDSASRLAEATLAAVQKQTPFDMVLTFFDRAKNEKRVRVIGKPIVANGVTTKIFATHQDVTKEIEEQETFRRMKDEAEAASIAKSAFLANMSHEIRTPLNGILGMAELVLNSELTDENRTKLETLSSSGRSLLAIVNDILDISRIEAGRLEIESVPFCLRDVIDEVSLLLKPQTEEKNVEFTWTDSTSEDLSRKVIGDPTRFRQILFNVLGNAVKFTSSGSITLQANLENTNSGKMLLHLIVTDTGTGISAQRLESIFEPFTQEDNTIGRRFGGTGLGLAITQRLIDMIGGKINIQSKLNQGTTVSLTLELEYAPDEILETPENNTTPINLDENPEKSPLILVAEDNAVNQEVITQFLNLLGCEIELAGDGSEALDLLKNNPDRFNMILMDIQMPGMDGLEATRAIRAKNIQLPIVAMTAHAMAGDRETCVDAGMNDYITKPLSIASVKDMVQKYCGIEVQIGN